MKRKTLPCYIIKNITYIFCVLMFWIGIKTTNNDSIFKQNNTNKKFKKKKKKKLNRESLRRKCVFHSTLLTTLPCHTRLENCNKIPRYLITSTFTKCFFTNVTQLLYYLRKKLFQKVKKLLYGWIILNWKRIN